MSYCRAKEQPKIDIRETCNSCETFIPMKPQRL